MNYKMTERDSSIVETSLHLVQHLFPIQDLRQVLCVHHCVKIDYVSEFDVLLALFKSNSYLKAR